MSMLKIRFGEFLLDEARYALLRGGEVVALRPKAFDLLVHLARHADRVVLREELVRVVWGGTRVGAGSLAGLVNELRRALGERGRDASVIRTVHARGYQFVGDARACGEHGAAKSTATTNAPAARGEDAATVIGALAAEATRQASAVGPFGVLFEAETDDVASDSDAATAFLEACARHGFETHRIRARVGVAMTPPRIARRILESLLARRAREEVADALPLPARRWLAARPAPVAGGPSRARLDPPGGLTAIAACAARCAGARPIALLLESLDPAEEGVATALAAFFRALGAAPVVLCVAPDPSSSGVALRRGLVRESGFRVFVGGDAALRRERHALDAWRAAWDLGALPAEVEAALIGHLRGDRPLERAEWVAEAAADPTLDGAAKNTPSATTTQRAGDLDELPRPALRRVEPGARPRLVEGEPR